MPATGLVTSGWSQPPASNRAVLYQAKTDPLAPVIPEPIFADKWIYPWSEPPRVRPGIHASRQAFFFADPFSLTQAEAVHLQWWQPFSLPRWERTMSVALQRAVQPFFPAPPPSVATWLMPLSLPVLPRSYFSALAAWSGPIQTMQPVDILGQPSRTVYIAAQTRTVVFLGEQG